MALSGSQITGIGVIGFPGRAYAGFTAKAETVPTPNLTFGIFARIDPYPTSVTGVISAFGKSIEGKISQSFGVYSKISQKGESVEGTISQYGKSVKGKL